MTEPSQDQIETLDGYKVLFRRTAMLEKASELFYAYECPRCGAFKYSDEAKLHEFCSFCNIDRGPKR